MSDPERDKVMVQELLELKTKMDNIVAKAFQDNIKFYDVLRESFESVINRRQNKPAELIGEQLLPPCFFEMSSPPPFFSFFPQQNTLMHSSSRATRNGPMKKWTSCWTRSWFSSDTFMVRVVLGSFEWWMKWALCWALGKDVFEAFYKKDLAKRLLLGKSASFDAEKSMLLKLKQGVLDTS